MFSGEKWNGKKRGWETRWREVRQEALVDERGNDTRGATVSPLVRSEPPTVGQQAESGAHTIQSG